MANCGRCGRQDGWNHNMVDYKDKVVPICTLCFRKGCEKCGQPFNGGPDRRPMEIRLKDHTGYSDDTLLVCVNCYDILTPKKAVKRV